MKSASMGIKFIPSSPRERSRSRTRFSRRSRRSCELLAALSPRRFLYSFFTGRTSNIEHSTSNFELARCLVVLSSTLSIECSMFDVQSAFLRRVMGAWWPSRSSKPLSARFTGRGKFDSYPLRQISNPHGLKTPTKPGDNSEREEMTAMPRQQIFKLTSLWADAG